MIMITKHGKGYFLNMFTLELLTEPVCYIWGDVYFSEDAIKKIVESDTDSILFFCSYNNKSNLYLKSYDEPFAYKVVDIELFKKHIEIVKKLYDEGKTNRHPIVWELYRSINSIDVNEHLLTKNFISINDETCDIDKQKDIDLLKVKLRKDIDKKLTIIIPYYKTYELTEKLLDVLIKQLNDDIEVYLIDDGCDEKRLDKYSNCINVIHLKENHGYSYAINVGIKSAKGKYIAMVDSDDMIRENYVREILNVIDNNDADLINIDWEDINTGIVVHRPKNLAQWRSIYKRDVIVFFDESVRHSADFIFRGELREEEKSCYYLEKVLYEYNSNRIGSLSWEKKQGDYS